jgi:regulator of RNase E activity RraA
MAWICVCNRGSHSWRLWVAAALAALGLIPVPVPAQVMTLTRDQLIKYTSLWKDERFPDGRPKVPDGLLEKVKGLSSEEINLARRGFNSQYVDGFHNLGKKLVGRAITLQLAPARPDVGDVVQSEWREKGNQRALDHQTVIDLLGPDDVFVVDAFGSIPTGGIIGDNLAWYIWKKTGTGFVIDGAIRDIEGIEPYGMPGFFRGATPPAIHGTMVMGINVPVRIGATTVMPGDVVFGDKEGVTFIPPHLVKEIVDAADVTHIHDDWTRKKFEEGKYKSTDIYSSPRDPALQKEYQDYLKQKLGGAAPSVAPRKQ